MKGIIKFSKGGLMQYIGHLDLMRYFQRAIVRAKLPVAYSAGFNPHQILSFAMPLGIGQTSEAEYLDIEFTEKCDTEKMKDDLNKQMVEGMHIISIGYLDDNAKPLMSLVSACSYNITCRDTSFNFHTFDNWVKEDSFVVIKKTKKSENEVDIKSMILKVDIAYSSMDVTLAAGSAGNLKPSLLMKAFSDKFLSELSKTDFRFVRTEMLLKNEEGNLEPLWIEK